MLDFNLEQVGIEITERIKKQSWFPYKTGNLKFNATQGAMYDANTFRIHFDSSIAPYVEYLEEGTDPHDIPRAFGRNLPFGIGGRFNGKFHPGSKKHQGFIKDKCVNEIITFITQRYEGQVEVI